MNPKNIAWLTVISFLAITVLSLSDFNHAYSCCPSGGTPPPPVLPPKPKIQETPKVPPRPPTSTGLEPLVLNPPSPVPNNFGMWEVWWIKNRLNYLPFKTPLVWDEEKPIGQDETIAVQQNKNKLIDRIAAVLKNDKVALTRAMAALALGKTKNRNVVKHLKESLENDKEFFVQNVVCLSLGLTGDPSAVEDLRKIIFTKKLISVTRAYAVLGLGYIKDNKSVETLKELLVLKDGEKIEKDIVCSALLSLGNLQEKAQIPLIEKILNNSKLEEDIRSYAALALGRMGDAEAIPLLNTALKDAHKTPKLRASITIAFGLIKSPEAKNTLIELLAKDKIPTVRQFAVISLAQLGDKSAYNIILDVVKGKEIVLGLKEFAIIALGILGEEKACDTLRELLTKKNTPARSATVIALGLLKDKKSVPLLLEILEKEEFTDPVSWLYACQALGMIGDESAINAVEKIYQKAQKELAVAANVYNNLTVSLAMLGKRQEILETLHNRINNKELMPQFVLHALHGIAYIGDKSSLEKVMDFYDGEQNPDMRQYAMFAIGFILDTEKINPLYKITADTNYDIRLAILDHVFTSKPD
ncbi:MAG: HEAT repeat domain-containing protein [Planctomycetes bacterium]|nr:HEAT repeat domain-containing protein [Planctomycetota bacterium]